MDFLKDLRSKSSSTKTNYAFVVAGVVTGTIGVFWLTTLSLKLPEVEQAGGIEKEETLSDFLGDTQEQFGNVIDATREGAELLNQVSDTFSNGEDSEGVTMGNDTEIEGALGLINERHIRGEDEAESPFAPKSSTSSVATVATTTKEIKEKEWVTWEKQVLIETTNARPKTILISTTTSQKP